MLSVKACLLATKTCLTSAFVTQQPFGIPNWNLDTCIFVAWTISVFHHNVVSGIVLAVLPQYDVVMHARGPIAIASIQVASTSNSIHRGQSSVKWASPTQGGHWLAQTNYDALMTHHTTENILYLRHYKLPLLTLYLNQWYIHIWYQKKAQLTETLQLIPNLTSEL